MLFHAHLRFIILPLFLTLWACGSTMHIKDLRTKANAPKKVNPTIAFALSEGGHDFAEPAESTRFSAQYRLDYLARANSALAIVKADCTQQSMCDRVVTAGGKPTRVVYFRDAAVYDLSPPPPPTPAVRGKHCFNITSTTADMIVIEGQGRGLTRLSWSDGAGCNGTGIQSTETTRETTIVVRKLTIEGGYAPWDGEQPTRTPKVHPTDSSHDCAQGSDCKKWQKAILVKSSVNHVHVEKVEINGFYYALAAQEQATGFGYDIIGRNAGDAVFFAYTGGQLHLEKAEARDAADISRGLGFGFVAESLTNGEGGFKICRDAVDANQYSNDEARQADFWGCVTHLSYYLKTSQRSLITAINSFAHENLKGGFLANSGAVIVATYAKSFAHRASAPVLSDANALKPNVYGAGYLPTGFGFNARHMAKLRVSNALSYENYIGFQAHDDATIDARYSKAWRNDHYGYHAVRYGRINGDHSQSFGPNQKWGYAADAATSSIDVTAIWLMQAVNPPPTFCVWPQVSPCPHMVAPDYQTKNYNMPIVPGNPGMGLFYRP